MTYVQEATMLRPVVSAGQQGTGEGGKLFSFNRKRKNLKKHHSWNSNEVMPLGCFDAGRHVYALTSSLELVNKLKKLVLLVSPTK